MESKAPKKKTKYVPITKKKNSDSYVMPGRQKCECAATKHELINNCTSCGRIVCSQEGSGPCWFCGELVCTNEDFEKISRNSNKNQSLMQQLLSKTWSHQDKDINMKTVLENNINESEESKFAEERKQRLLEFDRTSARRTKVIDDERDYYQTEGKVWIDPKNRELLKQKEQKLRDERHASKHSQPMKYTLDFKSRQFIEEKPSNDAAYELFEEPELEIMKNYSTDIQTESNIDTGFLEYIASKKKQPTTQKENNQTTKNYKLKRIQDRELYEIRDEGMCLSMHQPWASLLVKGIKKHEGRSWFTNHRGRLWIAATAKVPSPELINECKQFYLSREVARNEFPTNYPTGCILGCVDVIDCLTEEDYTEMYPDGESGSPFIFICENPIELNLKFPVKGKHKIYKLETHVHNAAKCGIRIED